jgi:uncharacterized protein YggE
MEVFMKSLVRRVAFVLASAVLTALVSISADAQVATPTPAPQPPPFIAASGVGDARVVPDRAMLTVAVESQAPSAAKAGTDNAARQTRVIDAVKAAGVAAAQIRTSGYNVFPEYAQGDGRAPRITGYRAHNSVVIEVRDIAAVGKIIDAALAAGANNIGSMSLFASNSDGARKEALQKAVAKARTEAEAVASAAGGSLGSLLELSIEPYGMPQPLMRQAVGNMAMADATPIETGELTVNAMVRARWLFVSGR